VDAPYWDLRAALQVAEALGNPPLELVLLPEWDMAGAPVTPHQADLSASQGMGLERVLYLVAASGCRAVSIHASRDVGLLLCSAREDERERGKRQLQEAFAAAATLGAGQVVVHAWDTYAPRVSPERTGEDLAWALETSAHCAIRLSIEGIPVSDPGWTPVRLATAVAGAVGRKSDPDSGGLGPGSGGVTVDLNWAAMAGDLEDCFELAPGGVDNCVPLLNIHVQGAVRRDAGPHGSKASEPGEVQPRDGKLDYGSALGRLTEAFPKAQTTLELAGPCTLPQARGALLWIQRQSRGILL
jgi:hypothetical protein